MLRSQSTKSTAATTAKANHKKQHVMLKVKQKKTVKRLHSVPIANINTKSPQYNQTNQINSSLSQSHHSFKPNTPVFINKKGKPKSILTSSQCGILTMIRPNINENFNKQINLLNFGQKGLNFDYSSMSECNNTVFSLKPDNKTLQTMKKGKFSTGMLIVKILYCYFKVEGE
jgi:hypothetical protein